MGLLDRWSKKTKKTQLDETAKKADQPTTVVVGEKKTATRVQKGEQTKKIISDMADLKISSVADRVLVSPLVTEKAATAGARNQYGFIVYNHATKSAIKKAVESIYGIKPTAVNVLNISGKLVRFGRYFGRRSDYKKALVTLPPGKTINIHEGV